MDRYFALIPAAGVGSRMGGDVPKQYLDLNGQPVIAHAIATLARASAIASVHVVISPEDGWWDGYDWAALLDKNTAGKLCVWRCGGATRAASVMNGLAAMREAVRDADWVLVHDAARPCLTDAMLADLLATLSDDEVGGLLAVPVADTLKRADAESRVAATVPRTGLWQAQTPQMFRYGLLTRALAAAGDAVTDEASAVEHLGLSPKLVEADSRNLKITYPRDLALASLILQHLV
jgi:2-C-methyl-D-erythritol 4-phosphate cytidylyltransferase